jgi:hypothetical protein
MHQSNFGFDQTAKYESLINEINTIFDTVDASRYEAR